MKVEYLYYLIAAGLVAWICVIGDGDGDRDRDRDPPVTNSENESDLLDHIKEERSLLKQEIRLVQIDRVVKEFGHVTIVIEAMNLSDFDIYECEFHCLLGDRERGKVWAQARLSGEIRGGCSAGELFTVKLVVLDDEKWRDVPNEGALEVSARPIAIYGINHEPLYDARDLAWDTIHAKKFLKDVSKRDK